MSSNIEHALISRVLQSKDFGTLDKLQITEDFFAAPEMKLAYSHLREHYHNANTAGSVPSPDALKHYFPGFNFIANVPDDVPTLCQMLRDQKVKAELFQLYQQIGLEAEKNPYKALATVRAYAQALSAIEHVGQDISMATAHSLLRQRYLQVSQYGGLLGIPYPWNVLNEETGGLQEGNYVVLYGRPKSMKTWVGLYMAIFAYRVAKKRVLYYTREMPALQIAQRAASAICGIDYRAYRNGKLDPNLFQYVDATVYDLFEDEMRSAKDGHQPCFIITADRSKTGGGVGWLQAKMEEVKPDLTIVDGVYLMKDDRSNQRTSDWKNILHISQDLRQTALAMNTRIIAITQANKKSDQMRGDAFEDMAYTDAFNQDADAVFKVKHIMRRDASGQKFSEIHMYAPGLREGILDGIVIHGVPATNFEFIRPIVEEEEMEEEGYGEKKAKPKPMGATFLKVDKPPIKDPVIHFKK